MPSRAIRLPALPLLAGLATAALALPAVPTEASPPGRFRPGPAAGGRAKPPRPRPDHAHLRRTAAQQLRSFQRSRQERLYEGLMAAFRGRGRVYGPGKAKDIIVLPSMSLDRAELRKIPAVHTYEERSLFTLLHLKDPGARVVFVSSQRIDPSIVDYYLNLLPNPADARRRLKMVSLDDGRPLGLTDKLLGRSDEAGEAERASTARRPTTVVREILGFVKPRRTHIYPFVVTAAEQHLSNLLQLPVLGTRSELGALGTKSGSRALFQAARVPHPAGSGRLDSVSELAFAVARLVEERPRARRLVVKLNEGFSGEGNALLPLEGIRRELESVRRLELSRAATQRLRERAVVRGLRESLQYQASGETWEHFSAQIGRLGAIAEEFVEGDVKTSPSVQLYVAPDGKSEILSTYEQILGGRDGQVYLGGRSPARAEYRDRLHRHGKRLAGEMARHGVVGRFAVDFIAAKQADGTWDLAALEINLRAGGTTHPTNTVKALVNPYGHYDERAGTLRSARDGQPKHYIASDTVGDPAAGDLLHGASLRGLTPAQVQRHLAELTFDRQTETGIVLHLMGAIREHGKVGFTAIGNSPAEAEGLYERTLRALEDAARTLPRAN